MIFYIVYAMIAIALYRRAERHGNSGCLSVLVSLVAMIIGDLLGRGLAVAVVRMVPDPMTGPIVAISFLLPLMGGLSGIALAWSHATRDPKAGTS